MNLETRQDANRLDDGRWAWAVWLEGPSESLMEVESVKYILHPTFKAPVQVRKNRSNKFRLNASGWGEFVLQLEIRLKNGKILRRSHELELGGTPELPKLKARGVHRIFISHSAADTPIAGALRDALLESGFTVADASMSPGTNWNSVIEQQLKTVDAVIVVISGMLSHYVSQEVVTARRLGLRLLPVLVGEKPPIPSDLADLQALRVREGEALKDIGAQITEALLEQLDEPQTVQSGGREPFTLSEKESRQLSALLFKKYRLSMLSRAMKLLRDNRRRAEELVSEVFLAAMIQADRILVRPESGQKAWLFGYLRILLNRDLAIRRSRATSRKRVLRGAGETRVAKRKHQVNEPRD